MHVDMRRKGGQWSNINDGIEALFAQEKEVFTDSPFSLLPLLLRKFELCDFSVL